jgi:hypothetical protein
MEFLVGLSDSESFRTAEFPLGQQNLHVQDDVSQHLIPNKHNSEFLYLAKSRSYRRLNDV